MLFCNGISKFGSGFGLVMELKVNYVFSKILISLQNAVTFILMAMQAICLRIKVASCFERKTCS